MGRRIYDLRFTIYARWKFSCGLLVAAAWLLAGAVCPAQTNGGAAALGGLVESLGHLDTRLTRQMNELLWFQRLSDVALVDKVRFTGPPAHASAENLEGAGSNQVVVSALTFMPKHQTRRRKLPLVVLVHGEVHGNLVSDEDVHPVRELIEQGYTVIAPDYRGSSGYGADYWRLIDYGGLEIEDVQAARRWMLEHYSELDPQRIGIAGWSHGGAIAMMTVFAHPSDYQACYAGVPVSDLEERIRILGKGYEDLFSAPYHLGKTVAEAPEEYHRRSPAWNAEKLRTPLLIHANTSDDDVKIQEVQKLLTALRAAGKDFQCHVYTNAPGGHLFNRLDTPLAQESRNEVWSFLARYLKPPRPVKGLKDETLAH